MADVTITIPLPKLIAGEYFKERHRLLPSSVWSGYTNRGNAAFTITGLSAGDYEFEFILVKADATECPAVYRKYTLYGDYECISFSSGLVDYNGIVRLDMTYTLPGGHTPPPCGWEVEYTDNNGNTTVVPYATLPASGKISMQVKNVSAILRIYALLCNGKKKQCHVNDVTPIFIPPPCTPMSGVNINLVEEFNNGKCEYFIEITFTQSSPATTSAHLIYEQTNNILNTDKFKGYVPLLPNATKLKWKINPDLWPGTEFIKYNINIIDRCGNGNLVIDEILWRSCF